MIRPFAQACAAFTVDEICATVDAMRDASAMLRSAACIHDGDVQDSLKFQARHLACSIAPVSIPAFTRYWEGESEINPLLCKVYVEASR